MRIKDLGPVAPIEALDVRVLIRLAWLDVVNRHAMLRAPIHETLGGEFGAVIDADRGGAAVHATSSSSVRVTRRLGTESPIAISKPSRFPSSIIVSKRTRRPSYSVSVMKSSAQV